ncbi:MAG: hypothetical protein COU10_03020 [Candidatus Harrisonbacteria bacterium CG10_big_fil_rev_8_21_14_0_10_45_28]|uniref:Uncharacterized protein n=1 Tax=Candidatus Harrisonbacteria bacterium CG10_big_fil_rev_8_21_14_0_10_45_28 TaxID=1974586 RepID=A0A2H0UMX0_9BACT|nr:MAG: hypothetical protein COU10_03020 [Candidatus Harrisonbacteria bacterium CG10_big_fil_rev_8_21_14_0_10_45_28]
MKRSKRVLGTGLLIAVLTVSFAPGLASAYNTVEVCPNTATPFSGHYETGIDPSGNPAPSPYTNGFDYGCTQYYARGFSFSCNYSMVPQNVTAQGNTAVQSWKDGCDTGALHGEAILKKKTKDSGLSNVEEIPFLYCDAITTKYFNGSDILRPDFKRGCDRAMWSKIVSFSNTNGDIICPILSGFNQVNVSACRDGFAKGAEETPKLMDLLAPVYRSSFSEACVDEFLSSSGHLENGFLRGCQAGATNASITCPQGIIDYAFSQNLQSFNDSFFAGCEKGKILAAEDALTNYDPGTTGIVPNCDATLPPNAPTVNGIGPCGISAAEQLIKNIITFLFWIVIPIAAIMIGWGGFTIMTSAGSAEKVKKGAGMITIALTGIAIMAISYLIIQFIFGALGVGPSTGVDITF